MPIPILMPALSPTMTEGTLAKWLKKEGDDVRSGDVIAEIETDKATMEVEAVDEGKIGKLLIKAGTENVAVNALIAVLLEEGENMKAVDLDALQSDAAPSQKAPAAPKKEAAPKPAPVPAKLAHPESLEGRGAQVRIFASPLAKRLAKEKGIDLRQITGTGPKGRIIKRDIEGFSPAAGGTYMPAPRGADGMPTFNLAPASNMRKAIARRLQQSKQEVPHFYLTIACEIDALLSVRKSINKKAVRQAGEGQKPAYKTSVNDFIIKAIGMALTEVPEANASWAGDSIKIYNSADVSVAVAIDDGLITPIVKDAMSKSIVQISQEVKDLAARARTGALQPQEYEGGTFTISNLGMFGIDEFSAIINPPQGAIMAIGQGKEQVVAKNGTISVATVMKCTLSVDHRAIDGAVGAQFLAAFRDYIQDPAMMLV